MRSNFDSFGGRAYCQPHILTYGLTCIQRKAMLLEVFETGNINFQGINSGGEQGKGVQTVVLSYIVADDSVLRAGEGHLCIFQKQTGGVSD